MIHDLVSFFVFACSFNFKLCIKVDMMIYQSLFCV